MLIFAGAPAVKTVTARGFVNSLFSLRIFNKLFSKPEFLEKGGYEN